MHIITMPRNNITAGRRHIYIRTWWTTFSTSSEVGSKTKPEIIIAQSVREQHLNSTSVLQRTVAHHQSSTWTKPNVSLLLVKFLGMCPICSRAHLRHSWHDTFECKQFFFTGKETRRFIHVTLMTQQRQ